MLIVRLLAAASLADDRIMFTNGASPDDFVAVCSPIGFQLVGRGGKWDKENRSSSGLRLGTTFPRSEPEAEPRLLKTNFQLEENNASRLTFLVVLFRRLAG
jgi:hypothetical protein